MYVFMHPGPFFNLRLHAWQPSIRVSRPCPPGKYESDLHAHTIAFFLFEYTFLATIVGCFVKNTLKKAVEWTDHEVRDQW